MSRCVAPGSRHDTHTAARPKTRQDLDSWSRSIRAENKSCVPCAIALRSFRESSPRMFHAARKSVSDIACCQPELVRAVPTADEQLRRRVLSCFCNARFCTPSWLQNVQCSTASCLGSCLVHCLQCPKNSEQVVAQTGVLAQLAAHARETM